MEQHECQSHMEEPTSHNNISINRPVSADDTGGHSAICGIGMSDQLPQLGEHDFLNSFAGAVDDSLVQCADEVPKLLLELGMSAATCSGSKRAKMGGEINEGNRPSALGSMVSDGCLDGHGGGEVKEEPVFEDGWEEWNKRKRLSQVDKKRSWEMKSDGANSPKDESKNKTNSTHSLYERRRRQKINQSLRALQMLVPNSHQADDQYSLLDKTIKHIKLLQAHGQMLSHMRLMSGMITAVQVTNNMDAHNTMMMMPTTSISQHPNRVPMQIGNTVQSMHAFFPNNMMFPAAMRDPCQADANAQTVPTWTPVTVGNPYPGLGSYHQQMQMSTDMDSFSSISRRSRNLGN